MNKWSSLPDFPSSCPPAEASGVNQEIYVYVKSEPPACDDFSCAFDKKAYKKHDPCLRMAISCGLEIKYLESIKSLFPAIRNWKMAVGVISNETGLLLKTCNNEFHYSFWINPESRNSIHEKFKVVKND